ncbi:hypothetical protein [Undibacterium sp. TS12]|uniref:hypothetical protein n=1 Tax=Undibacterium sp. TS12 TaxID=2908202 RepID=UPI001F4CABBB|nr:hypothetical protein [Undibacterium sp. TS12]MCH8618266.1 hypothetical protein [Undibacterium sp. TS12]
MATANPGSLLIGAAVGAFVVWRIVSRIRRMVGRQKYSGVRAMITICIFPILIALVAFGALNHEGNVLFMLGGLIIGCGLGVYGLRLTKFESHAGKFYTPNAHLGIALSLLMIGRIAWRMGTLYFTTQSFAAPPGDFSSSPLTLFLFGMLAAYYISYAIGLLRWSRSLQKPAKVTPSIAADVIENPNQEV